MVFAIAVGSWLIARSLNAELKLARQKTDFVSNVSHELKTPLTSIRMFSELLADGRVADPAKQKSYLNIITAEAARLTRLINNVLDFSRMESGEKKYNFQPCDLK
jgi:signal transduction histidine kinase